ncbi:hypothetical protein P879_01366 [Paragonimus westermani]|uniref:Calcium release-activated calcium channel protein 1 n=1 Tax=Paragonimus westermani TaxID=34504 RepID=A0A8T0DNX3_9TREM|nr:hypothetical protein P879_01366 [Paragonimus westermani]
MHLIPFLFSSLFLNSATRPLSRSRLESGVPTMHFQHTYPKCSNLTPQDSLSLRQLHLSKAKLKASSRVSALLAGFAMVALVELEISSYLSEAPQELLVAFTTLTCLLIAVHVFAVMISTCLLPHLDSYVSIYGYFGAPLHRLKIFVEVAWIFSTVIGIFLFLAVVVLACWIKFWRLSPPSAVAATTVIIPALLLFLGFSVLFYYTLVCHKMRRATELMAGLDMRLHSLERGELRLGPSEEI